MHTNVVIAMTMSPYNVKHLYTFYSFTETIQISDNLKFKLSDA